MDDTGHSFKRPRCEERTHNNQHNYTRNPPRADYMNPYQQRHGSYNIPRTPMLNGFRDPRNYRQFRGNSLPFHQQYNRGHYSQFYQRPRDNRINNSQFRDDRRIQPDIKRNDKSSVDVIKRWPEDHREDEDPDPGKSEVVRNKVELLKEKKRSSCGKSTHLSTSSVDVPKMTESDESDQAPVSNMQRSLDLYVTCDDYKNIGTGTVCSTEDKKDNQDIATRSAETSEPPGTQPHVKAVHSNRLSHLKSTSQSENSDAFPYDLENEKLKREEYERVADTLKPLLLKKDKNWLSSLVNSAQKSDQRILVTKLIEEHRSTQSRVFNMLRFANDVDLRSRASGVATSEMNSLPEPSCSFEIDLRSLPDELITTIENLIKKEVPDVVSGNINLHHTKADDSADIDDDIVEVPVPPPPEPLLVDLENEIVGEGKVEEDHELHAQPSSPVSLEQNALISSLVQQNQNGDVQSTENPVEIPKATRSCSKEIAGNPCGTSTSNRNKEIRIVDEIQHIDTARAELMCQLSDMIKKIQQLDIKRVELTSSLAQIIKQKNNLSN